MQTSIRISSVLPQTFRNLLRLCVGALGAAACASAIAADARTPPDITARYQRERAACENGKSGEDRATCLREAAAARDDAAHGKLEEPGNYEKNALARCDAVPPADRDACRHRARGEGEMKGSVSGGGIIREYREITLPPAAPRQDAMPGSSGPAPATANESQRQPTEQKQDDRQGR